MKLKVPDDGERVAVEHPDDAYRLLALAGQARAWVTVHRRVGADVGGIVTDVGLRSATLDRGTAGGTIAYWEVDAITMGETS